MLKLYMMVMCYVNTCSWVDKFFAGDLWLYQGKFQGGNTDHVTLMK